jgi:hypothetical protein
MSYKPGEEVEFGLLYVGVSPSNNRDMFVPVHEEWDEMRWRKALRYARRCRDFGRSDWRLPTSDEWHFLHKQKDKGRFRDIFNDCMYNHRTYWTSHPYFDDHIIDTSADTFTFDRRLEPGWGPGGPYFTFFKLNIKLVCG